MSFYRRLAELEMEATPFVLVTVIQTRGSVPRHEGTKMLVFPDGSFEGTIGGGEVENIIIHEAIEALSSGKPRRLHYNFVDPERGDPGVCGGEMDIFVDPIHPKPTLLIFGMGHVGKAVAHLGSWLGFRIVIADDREEFVSEESVLVADRRVPGHLEELPGRVDINDQTYVVLTTRGVPIDVKGVPALLETPAAYIGIIGSRRRWETTARELKRLGIENEEIARVSSPMGLEIRAETPEEIALSIMAEIIMIQRGGTGKKMAQTRKTGEKVEGE